jgi:excisionase family DNA binding protein
MKKQILDIEDVAKLKEVHPGTVYHWVERGKLNPIRIGRSLFFSRKEIMKWQPPKKGRKPNRKGGE